MSGTSSIEQLPNEITKNNVIMSVEEKVNNSSSNVPQQMQQPGLMPQQNAINTVVNGLQNVQYSTDLPNRDIPMNTNHITHDNTTRPNYVPEADPNKRDYIGEEESLQEMANYK